MARSVGMAIAYAAQPMATARGARSGEDAASSAANDADRPHDPAHDERDVGRLIAAKYRWMIAYSRKLTANGPEATDLVHIVIIRVLSQPAPIASVENLSGWLRTVLFRTFIDLRRRERWEIPTDSAALERPATAPEEEPGNRRMTMEDLRVFLAALPAHYRVPYEMFTFDHVPYARIAVVLGLSCKTVGTRINRARERLRQMIQAHQGG